MLKTLRTIKNTLNEEDVAQKIKLYKNEEANNPSELEEYSSEIIDIHRLTSIRDDNLSVFARNTLKVIAKRSAFLAPIVMLALTSWSIKNTDYTKKIYVPDIYKNTVLEFDEDSILRETNLTYAKTGTKKDYVDESIISLNEFATVSTISDAVIYYGEGSKSLQVKFNINNDHTWSYASHTNNLYEKSQVEVPESIRKTDGEYLDLIKEVTETFIKQADLNEEEMNYVRELVSNSENDILVKIRRCVREEGLELEYHSSHWLRNFLAVIATLVVICVLVKYIEDLFNCDALELRSKNPYDCRFDDCQLKVSYICQPSLKRLLKATKEYREQYLLAESNRLKNIIDILKTHNAEPEIIDDYSKRLKISLPKNHIEKDKEL